MDIQASMHCRARKKAQAANLETPAVHFSAKGCRITTGV
jgi:hypothetical protein